jgi:hypothetical protein
MMRLLGFAAALTVLLLAGCGSEATEPPPPETEAVAALECDGDQREAGELDHAGDEPGIEGDPVEVVGQWMDDANVELTAVGNRTVAVQRDGRVVALVEVRDWPAGGRVVASFEACAGAGLP